MQTICQQNPHLIFGDAKLGVKVDKFLPKKKPPKARTGSNDKVNIDLNETVDHEEVCKEIFGIIKSNLFL